MTIYNYKFSGMPMVIAPSKSPRHHVCVFPNSDLSGHQGFESCGKARTTYCYMSCQDGTPKISFS